jgi:hypothetical protein
MMPTRSDAVLAALADGATNRNEIAEATGLEVEAVSQDLSILRGKGLVDKNADGWYVTGGTPGRKEHLQVEPTEAPKPARKAPRKSNGGGSAAAPKASPGTPQVAVFGNYVVMHRADAERLLDLQRLLQQAGFGG